MRSKAYSFCFCQRWDEGMDIINMLGESFLWLIISWSGPFYIQKLCLLSCLVKEVLAFFTNCITWELGLFNFKASETTILQAFTSIWSPCSPFAVLLSHCSAADSLLDLDSIRLRLVTVRNRNNKDIKDISLYFSTLCFKSIKTHFKIFILLFS